MKKETLKITIKVEGENQFKPHYLSSERTFEVEAYRGRLFISLDSFEKKMQKKYPVTEKEPVSVKEVKPISN